MIVGILLISLIPLAYGLCPPYPMSNASTTLWQPTFATTTTISVGTGSPLGHGIGVLTAAPAVANLSSNIIGPSSPAIQTPVVFSSVPWSTDDDLSLPTVTTIWL
ncbi:hypothetical protein F5B19DRAFT_501879 [Rostrohypoxylon terebratum]|nr:hypothetical protein F5B19DRAFT_501879 [Rostrohypoxylon terebratum]